MFVIAIVSAKGGVGKTTVSANLAAGFAQRGRPVLVIDLDPQNAMQWHLGGLDPDVAKGISSLNASRTRLAGVMHQTAFDVALIPYGSCSEQRRQKFEATLAAQDDWLKTKLTAAKLPDQTIVILDTPPGPSVYLKQAMRAADFLLAVVLADAASYSTLPEMEELIASYTAGLNVRIGSAYLINQGNQRQLAQDVLTLFAEKLGQRMLPFVVPESDAVEEALAFEKPVVAHQPENAASQNIFHITDWIIRGLPRQAY